MRLYCRLNEDSIVINCGAHEGNSTNELAETGALVYAYEPNKVIFGRLANRFKACVNVRCIPLGLWSTTGIRRLYKHPNADKSSKRSKSSSMIVTNTTVDSRCYDLVSVMDVSEVVRALSKRINLFKINAEGAEISIINRLIDTKAIDLIDCLIVAFHVRQVENVRLEKGACARKIIDAGLNNVGVYWKNTNTVHFKRVGA